MTRKGTYIAYDAFSVTDSVNSNLHIFRLLEKWQHDHPEHFNFVNMFGIKFSTVHEDMLDSTLKSYMIKEMTLADNMLVLATPVTNTDSLILNWQISRGVNRFHLPVIIAYYGLDVVDEATISQYSVWLPQKIHKYISLSSWARMAHIPFSKDKLSRALNTFSASRQSYPWNHSTIF